MTRKARIRSWRIDLIAVCCLCALPTACAVGPDFASPSAGYSSRYTREGFRNPTSRSRNGQVLDARVDVPGQWWSLFRSPALNQVVLEAVRNNPNLEAARAAVRVADFNVEAQKGTLFPQIGAGFQATQQKVPIDLSAPLNNNDQYNFSLFTPQLTLAFTPDVFGGNRREIESLQAQAENLRFQLEAAYLTLISNVALAAIQEASLRRQIDATNRVIRIETDILAILRTQQRLGQVGGTDVAQQEAVLAQAQQQIPPLDKSLAQQRNLLTALVGSEPSNEIRQTFTFETLRVPRRLPLSVPSLVVQQRPDVRAAEATLHSASAEIGVAIANRLPQFTVTGNGGYSATKIASLFAPGTNFYTIIGAVAQPIFDAGTLQNRQRAAEETFNQYEAQYRNTVVSALQNVADTLRALESDVRLLQATTEAEAAAARSVELTRIQFQSGAVNVSLLLLAQQTFLQATLNSVQAQATQYSDTVNLFGALGGGWWNREDDPKDLGTRPSRDDTEQRRAAMKRGTNPSLPLRSTIQ